jgi:hypothetical protein
VWATVAGCSAGIDARGPVTLAESVPGLLRTASAIVFTYSAAHDCRTLVDASTAELDVLLGGGAELPLQRVPMLRGAVDAERDGAFDDTVASHTFASVPVQSPVSFLALAVTRDPGRDFTIASLQGTVFAVGCRSVLATSNTNVGLPIVLMPAGLR